MIHQVFHIRTARGRPLRIDFRQPLVVFGPLRRRKSIHTGSIASASTRDRYAPWIFNRTPRLRGRRITGCPASPCACRNAKLIAQSCKSRRAFGRKHDTILWYARGPEHAFYPEAVRVARKPGSHMRIVRDGDGREVQVKRDRKTGKLYRYPVSAGKIPEDYWTDIETLNRGDRQRTGWPTQKPEALLARIILATTRPGDLVGDFFCGSGTTAAVADRLGRRFIAVDSSEEAIRLTRARLAQPALGLRAP